VQLEGLERVLVVRRGQDHRAAHRDVAEDLEGDAVTELDVDRSFSKRYIDRGPSSSGAATWFFPCCGERSSFPAG
jgi:hypothetical protein